MIAFSSKNHLYVTVLSGFIKRGPQLSAKSTNGSMTLKSLGTTGLWATYSLKAICPNFLLAGVSWKLKSFGTFSHHTPSPFSPQHIPPPSSPQHTPLPSSPQHAVETLVQAHNAYVYNVASKRTIHAWSHLLASFSVTRRPRASRWN